MRIVVAITLATCLSACGEETPEEFLGCAEKCDSVGPLTVSRRWVPEDGFLRVVLAGDHRLAVVPPMGVTIESNESRHTVTFSQPGYYAIVASNGDAAVADLPVRVADEGPAFAVSAPAAGAFLPLTGAVAVEGTVVDPLGQPLRVEMAGVELPIAAGGAFRAELAPVFGVNYVELTATDAAGNRFVYSHGFMSAPRYGGGETTVQLAAAEETLDLLAAKLSPLIPELIHIPAVAEPIADPLAHRIYFDGATLPGQDGNPGAIQVSLDSLDGALRTSLRATGDLIARAHVDNWVLSDTKIVATASDLVVDATVRFAAEPVVDALRVDFSNFDLQIGSIPGWLPGLLVEASKGVIGTVMKGRVGPIIGQVLGSVQGDFRLALELPCLALETPFTLSYRLGAITPQAGRLGLALGAQARHEGAEGPGAPARDEQATQAAGTGPLSVGIGYNLMNQFMYELWHAGALKITLNEGDLKDVIEKLPVISGLDPVLDIKAELTLPPVIERGTNGSIRFSFAELRLEMKIDAGVFQIAVTVNVGARTEVELTIEDGAVRVTPVVKELHLDLGRRAFSGLNPEAVESLVRAIVPELVARIAGSLEAFRLPEFDLASAGLPGVRLGIQSGTVTGNQHGATFTGSVSVITNTPAPSTGPGCRAPR